jgi:hypothetical protein
LACLASAVVLPKSEAGMALERRLEQACKNKAFCDFGKLIRKRFKSLVEDLGFDFAQFYVLTQGVDSDGEYFVKSFLILPKVKRHALDD